MTTPETRADELELIRKAQRGDKEATELLIEMLGGLVRGLSWKLIIQLSRGRRVDFEDVYQVGYLAALKAIKRFKPSKGCGIKTYAWFWVRAEVQSYLLAHNRQFAFERTESDTSPLDHQESTLSSPELPIDSKATVAALLGMLQHQEREVVVKRYGLDGETARDVVDIAKDLGCSRAYVYQILNRAYARMKRVSESADLN